MSDNILTKIIASKKLWLTKQQQDMPLATFVEHIEVSQRDFYKALRPTNNATAYILECKKASPSKGLIRDDFNPIEIANAYLPYASVISVLTDQEFFQGDFAYLPLVSQVVTQPVLCKDFIIDSYQIKLARYYQADAILLMLSVLDDQQYQQLTAVANQLKMGILTEVSTQAELQRALALKAKVIGINNRNLRDLSIDLSRTPTFASKIPATTTIISESGINSFNDIQQLRPFVNGFLIGSSLMQHSNLPPALRKLLLGHNKVCGLTRVADAQAAFKAGAVYGGLIFAKDSPRCINMEKASQIFQQVPQLNYVAVFRQPLLATVVQVAQQLPITAVQLHGDFSQQQIYQLRQQLPQNCQIWLAIKVEDKIPALNWENIDFYVLDNGNGGSGNSFNWQLLKQLPVDSLRNVILAGGLNPNNCKQAVELGCAGLDFNSGVETTPGIKDPQLIEAAFAQIRGL